MKPISTKSAEYYQWGNGCGGWHLVKDKNLSVIEETVPSGEGENRHYHVNSQQFFYILSGTVVVELDGVEHILDQGMGLHVPSGLPHVLENRGATCARFLVISQPRSHGDRVEA